MLILKNKNKNKISQLNAAIMTLDTIMRKSVYFCLIKFHTHDLFIIA
jgi:hypothetical protein